MWATTTTMTRAGVPLGVKRAVHRQQLSRGKSIVVTRRRDGLKSMTKTIQTTKINVRTRSSAASSGASSGGDDAGEGVGASCDLEFMKMVSDDANAPTTGYALQATILGACVATAVMLYVALDMGSAAFTVHAWSRVVGAMAKSGFTAAFALIFVSELGDKTFFIAALLAMRLGRFRVLMGATAALGTMTVISVAIGRAFQRLPSSLATTLPVGEYAAVAMLVFFGLKTLRDALEIPESGSTPEEHGELAEATEVVCKSSTASSGNRKVSPALAALIETFTLIFIAEWGDRSMLATIALGAAQNPIGVTFGATLGHFTATMIAVVGGSLLSKKISERTVGIIGGCLFLVFALFTSLGIF
jgi:putative Ca2+/H+ antiporter (TMEM165/GDT1 family)